MVGHIYLRPVLLFIASGLLSACGNSPFTARASNPVIVDYQAGDWTSMGPFRYGIISTTAGRRSIFIDYNQRDNNGNATGPKVCAEPPPDAIDAYANALAVSGKGGEGPVNAEAKLERTLAVSSGLGLYRSQG